MTDKKIRGKWVIARFQHETNTFSPIHANLEDFNPFWGPEAYQDQENARTAMGAFIDIAKQENVEIVTPVCAFSNPSDTVCHKAYERICDSIIAAVEQGCDAILLDLHGAMVSEIAVDGEGNLLQRIKSIAPNTPIAVALDLHGNVTPAMIENCDVMVSFKTYPHIDIYETVLHAGNLLRDYLKVEIKPFLVCRQIPLPSHTLRSNTNEGAMKAVVDAAKTIESKPGIIAHSPGDGPVLLLDHSDNVMSGGSCDTTDILEAALGHGLNNIPLGLLLIPQQFNN